MYLLRYGEIESSFWILRPYFWTDGSQFWANKWGSLFIKGLKITSDGSAKVPKMVMPRFRTPTTFFESLMLLYAVAVEDENIKKKR